MVSSSSYSRVIEGLTVDVIVVHLYHLTPEIYWNVK